jgi:hypothetical protein
MLNKCYIEEGNVKSKKNTSINGHLEENDGDTRSLTFTVIRGQDYSDVTIVQSGFDRQ